MIYLFIAYLVGAALSTAFWVEELKSHLRDDDAAEVLYALRNSWWSYPLGVLLWPIVWLFRLCIYLYGDRT